jgi:hypothetical protein
MLQISLAAYSVMNLQDAIIGAFRGDLGLIVGATVFMLLPGYMAFRLSRL